MRPPISGGTGFLKMLRRERLNEGQSVKRLLRKREDNLSMVAHVRNPDTGEAGRQTPGAHCTGV